MAAKGGRIDFMFLGPPQPVTGSAIEVTDFIGIVNFEWHSQNKIVNIGILVFRRDREKLYCSDVDYY